MIRMRIVGGAWRGRAIAAPEGRHTRPTTERMRESLASMVLSACGLDLSGLRVLDAFAGSGAVGLELLSRGAARCTFVERDRRAANVVRSNARSLGALDVATIVCADVTRLASGPIEGGPFALVVLDPPYAVDADVVSRLVGDLVQAGALTGRALVAYEREGTRPGLSLPGFSVLRERTHGITAVTLFHRKEAHE